MNNISEEIGDIIIIIEEPIPFCSVDLDIRRIILGGTDWIISPKIIDELINVIDGSLKQLLNK